jgi:hypothetical protein
VPASRSKTWRQSISDVKRSDSGQLGESGLIGFRAPQPRRHGIFLDPLQAGRDAGLAEVFLGDDVGRYLAPAGWNLDAFQAEHDGAVGIANLAGGGPELDGGVGRLAFRRVVACNPHCLSPAPGSGRLASESGDLCHDSGRCAVSGSDAQLLNID